MMDIEFEYKILNHQNGSAFNNLVTFDIIKNNIPKLSGFTHKNYDNFSENEKIYKVSSDYNVNIEYFIEGTEDPNNIVFIKPINSIWGNQIISSNYPNKVHKLENIESSKRYEVYDLYGRSNIINKNQIMIKGFIEGSIVTSKCDPNIKFHMLCFSSEDHKLIGKYNIENNLYHIPNLDCNSEYDIILVDESKVLEQKVQSRRKPIAYNPVNERLYTIIDANITEHDESYINIKLLYDKSNLNNTIGKIRVYYSNDNIDKNNLSIYPYVETDSVFNIKIPIIVSKFLVEHKSYYQTDYYNFVNSNRSPRNLTYKIEYEKFRSAPIALKHKLEYDEE